MLVLLARSTARSRRPGGRFARDVFLRVVFAWGFLLFASDRMPARAQEAAPRGVEFFEQKIRPVLVQHCYACHSADAQRNKKLQGGLFLDSAEGVAKGGESGAILVAGKPEESLLVKALRYDGVQMPPSGKLPDQVVIDFVKWIELGTPDPRRGGGLLAPKRVIDVDQGRAFWSYRPLTSAPHPVVADPAWSKTPIDRFISARHAALGLRPSAPASRETLIRRAYFDLIGLPPTPEQIDAFVGDPSPQAFEKVVDELLESPHYGERWGRHWLDVARFAESGGYEFDGFRPGAYHYRDWVIRALNADMPYDEFVRMQLAGDKLRPGYEGAAAIGFLVAGPYPGQITAKTVERIRYDQLDDMLMTIGGSMLGVTIGCVRCHEHKYDPIPQTDYYALAATFATSVHGTVHLDPDPASTQRALEQHARDHEAKLAALREYAASQLPQRFAAWQKDELPRRTAEPRWQTLDLLSITTEDTWMTTTEDGSILFVGPRRKESDRYVVTARTYQQKLTGLRLDALTHKSLPRKGPGLGGDGSFALGDLKATAKPLDPGSKETPVTLKLKPALAAFEEAAQPLKNAVDDNPGTFWRSNADGGKDNAALFEIEGGFAGFAGGSELTFELKFVGSGLGRFRLAVSTEPGAPTWAGEILPQHLGEIRAIVAANGNSLPEKLGEPMVRWFAAFDETTNKVRLSVDEHARGVPRPPLTEVYTTVAGGQDVFLLRRGEVDNKLGKSAPGVLQVLTRAAVSEGGSASAPATKPADPDPRVALAHWMTDVEHGAGPLLARVIVNRVWQHHFGEGIVGTPNDFGQQGDRPTHPELLDWLALQLVQGGWKLKPLHRAILLSEAWQQGNDALPENLRIDPENKQFWQQKPRRLEAETIRDALLAVGNSLDTTMYGPSFLDNVPRRSVYLRVKRSELIPFMTMFDAPEPTQSIGERVATTVPTQALAMMNSPFVRQQAEKLAARVRQSAGASGDPVDAACRIALSRSATAIERERMTAFLDGGGDKGLVEVCHVLLCLNEFVYVD